MPERIPPTLDAMSEPKIEDRWADVLFPTGIEIGQRYSLSFATATEHQLEAIRIMANGGEISAESIAANHLLPSDYKFEVHGAPDAGLRLYAAARLVRDVTPATVAPTGAERLVRSCTSTMTASDSR